MPPFLKLILLTAIIIVGIDGFLADTTDIKITRNDAEIQFPELITFSISTSASQNIEKIILFYGTNAVSCQSGSAQQALDFVPSKSVESQWVWELQKSGALPPGAEVWWQWEITDIAGNIKLSDRQTLAIQDNRYDWNLIHENNGELSIQWYFGNQVFGDQLMDIAQKSLVRLSNKLGVSASGPIYLTIYQTSEEVQEALIHTWEWTGGVAFPEYGAVITGITPGQTEWAEEVIPHELAHLLVEKLVFNCKGVWLPTWLSEGLAVNAEGDLSSDEHSAVSQAIEEGEIRPLHALERGFSPYPEQANLEYLQSGYIVEFMILEFGPNKMGELLSAIQSGLLIDEALQKTYLLDTDGLDSAWRVWLGFEALPTSQPTQASKSTNTPIPTIALYTSVVKISPTPTPPPTITPLPVTETPALTASPPPAITSPATKPDGASRSTSPFCGGAIGIPMLLLVIIFSLHRRKSDHEV